jgi:hypothetical protein
VVHPNSPPFVIAWQGIAWPPDDGAGEPARPGHRVPKRTAGQDDPTRWGTVMASDVNIPGDDLQDAQNTLTFVHDNIDLGPNQFDFDATFGPDLSRGSAQNFEDRWADGREQLRDQVQGVSDAIGNILDSFDKTDQDAVQNLDG